MNGFWLALTCWLGSGLGAALLRGRGFAALLGAVGAVGGGAAAAFSAVATLATRETANWSRPWSVPGGALALRIDPLSAVFLLPIGVIGALCAVYGVAYMRHGVHGRAQGGSFAAYNLLLASMAAVVAANDLLFLLITWELMTLTSWVLVVTDDEDPAVRGAGLQYLVAGHLGTAALLLLALLLATGSGSFEIAAVPGRSGVSNSLLFCLALVGFGTKAGIVPMHVWLPDAHPAAPSHVSALMSAVMVTMGFYGLARFIPLLGPPAVWWGYLLLLLGAVGAGGGILFANAQRDGKRVLAYSTVENVGIAALAMGLGLLGTAWRRPELAGIGWTAALLHLWNHALAKSTLFLGFGAIAQRVGSRDVDSMGGLLRRWPSLGAALLLSAAALASLPGLHVFTSEWLVIYGLLAGGATLQGAAPVVLFSGLALLGFVGSLALVCFTRLVGIALLGNPRSVAAERVPEPGWAMRVPILALAGAGLVIAIVPSTIAGLLGGAVAIVTPTGAASEAVQGALRPLAMLPVILVVTSAILLSIRWVMFRGSARKSTQTWGCGYASPTAAMQYTAMSFSEPVTSILRPVLATDVDAENAPHTAGLPWVIAARWSTRTPDRVLVGIFQPLFAMIERGGARLREFQRPRVTISLLYIVVTVLVLLGLLFLPASGG
jgi:formate hydrogenlyase subunit 3/multisubunit Na+/H+ antiporter MnhD subunit